MDSGVSGVLTGTWLDTDTHQWRSFRASIHLTPEGEGEADWVWEDTGEHIPIHAQSNDPIAQAWQRLFTPLAVR